MRLCSARKGGLTCKSPAPSYFLNMVTNAACSSAVTLQWLARSRGGVQHTCSLWGQRRQWRWV